MSRWFRWYEGTSEDGKFRVVARLSRVTVRDVIALWAFILEDAAHLDHRGVCTRNEDFMSSILDFEDGVVENVLSAMETADMISVGHGAITICNWGKRQFESDSDPTATKRQSAKRERDKQFSHEPVTRDSRPPETEADTETEAKENKAHRRKRIPTMCSDEFEKRFWKPYPRTPIMSKAEAWREWEKLSEPDREAACLAIPKFIDFLRSQKDHPAVHACRFLRQRRFEGFAPPDPENVVPIAGHYAAFSSEELDAWAAFERASGKRFPRDKAGGWRFPTQWPPNHEARGITCTG